MKRITGSILLTFINCLGHLSARWCFASTWLDLEHHRWSALSPCHVTSVLIHPSNLLVVQVSRSSSIRLGASFRMLSQGWPFFSSTLHCFQMSGPVHSSVSFILCKYHSLYILVNQVNDFSEDLILKTHFFRLLFFVKDSVL